MKEENIKRVYTKAHIPSKTTWSGLSITDALRSHHVEVVQGSLHRPSLPPGDPGSSQAVHIAQNGQGSGIYYLAIASPAGNLQVLDWSNMGVATRVAALQKLASNPIVAFDGMQVLDLFHAHGLPLPIHLTCLKTMARILENRAYPPGHEHLKPGYDLPQVRERSGLADRYRDQCPASAYSDLKAILTSQIIKADLAKTWLLEKPLLPIVFSLNKVGVGIDRMRMQFVMENARNRADTAAAELRKTLGKPDLNPDAHEDLLQALRDAGLQVKTTKIKELQWIDHPGAEAVVRYRTATTVFRDAERCLEAAAADGRVRPTWDSLGAGTGRMSCSDPAMQSLTGDPEFQECLIAAPEYVYVRSDITQADLRILASLCQDPALIAALAPDRDFHTETAARLLRIDMAAVTPEQRQVSKVVVFGISYGMSVDALARHARLSYGLDWTPTTARTYMDEFLGLYPGLLNYSHEVRSKASTVTETRTVLYGRRRLLPEGPEYEGYRYRRLLNGPSQGSVADCVKEAMIQVYPKLGSAGAIVLNLHDELIVEIREQDAEQVKAILQQEMDGSLARAIPGVPVKTEAKICRSLAD